MNRKMNVLIYNEFVHEKTEEKVAKVYPKGIHGALRECLEQGPSIEKITVATLEDHEKVITKALLDETDVVVWWGHLRHQDVSDQVVQMIADRVIDGMGFVALHSAHASKPFQKLLGTNTFDLRWRESDDKARLWNLAKNHPITQGIGDTFVVPADETYGEAFGIPEPDKLIFLTWFEGGEVFRSGCVWQRGEGKSFYLQNGHETYPIYYQDEIKTIIRNAVKWACPIARECLYDRGGPNAPAYETKKA
jgi:trehalose utilization protein